MSQVVSDDSQSLQLATRQVLQGLASFAELLLPSGHVSQATSVVVEPGTKPCPAGHDGVIECGVHVEASLALLNWPLGQAVHEASSAVLEPGAKP